MSTILKALRRLEEEKAASSEGRPLREEVASEPRAAAAGRGRGRVGLTFGLALVLGLGVGGAALWWLQQRGDEPAQVAAASDAAAAANPAAPAAAVAPPAASADAFASDVETVVRPERAPRIADGRPIEPSAAEKPGQRRPVESSSAAARAKRQAQVAEMAAALEALAAPTPGASAQAAPKPAPAPAPKPAPRPVAKPAPEPAPQPVAQPVIASVAPEPEPTFELPPLEISKTLWHPLPERRRAWVVLPGESAAREVVEGDVVGGLLVAKIEPSGVLFERDGQQARQPVGR